MGIGSTKIGVVLLDRMDRYVVNGTIPTRPDFDKSFLLELVKGRTCLASENTIKDLPNSIINSSLEIIENGYLKWEVNLGIKTFKNFPPDIFFVSRTPIDIPIEPTSDRDKYFDINWLITNYKAIISHHNLEIWIKN